MEKISGIVPRSRRVASADMTQAAAVRPGAPSFGRPIGSSTIGNKSSLTTADRAVLAHQKIADGRKSTGIPSDLVAEMTDKFFLQKTKDLSTEEIGIGIGNELAAPEMQAPGMQAPGVQTPDGSAANDIDAASDGEIPEQVELSAATSEEAEYVPPGTHLDVIA